MKKKAAKLVRRSVRQVQANLLQTGHPSTLLTRAEKPLAQRQLQRETTRGAMSSHQAAKSIRLAGGQAVARMALDMLRLKKLPAAPLSRQEAVQQHQALQLVDAILGDNPEEVEWLVAASLVKGKTPGSRRELEDLLEKVTDDPIAFGDMFAEAFGENVEPEKARKLLQATRRKPRQMGSVLRQLLGLANAPAMKRRNVSPEKLARDIIESGNNPELLAALLEGMEGMLGKPEQLAQIRALRSDARKLADYLRRMQGSPDGINEERDALRESVQGALRELELTERDSLHRSYNAERAAEGSGDPNQFLDAYHEVVETGDGFTKVLRTMLRHYSADKLGSELSRMKQALGDDLHAATPSHDMVRLSAILKDISNMHLSTSLLTMVEQFRENCEGAARAAGIEPKPIDTGMLMRELVDIVDTQFVAPRHFETLLKTLGIRSDQEIIIAMQGIMGILREMPDRIFRDDKVLPSLLKTAQELLDATILREEDQQAPTEAA
jgi:type III secretion system TyeA family effector delivery regulator